MEKIKFLVITLTVAILLSALSTVSFMYPAFAQDVGFNANNKNTNTGNTGVTGSSPYRAYSNTSIKLSPDHGPPGTEFYIYGTGFPHVIDVAIMSPSAWKIPSIMTSTTGFFVDEGKVPTDAAPGSYTVDADAALGSGSATTTFTVTAKVSNTTPTPKPPVQAPKPPADTTTNTATGGGSELPYITLDPTFGYPGTVVKIKGGNFVGEATLSVGGKVTAKSSNTNLNGDSISEQTDGSISGVVTIPESAPPGPLPIQVDSSAPDAKAIFDVLKQPTFTNAKTTPALQSSTDAKQTNPTSNISKKGTLGTGTVTSSSGANSGNPSNPAPSPPKITKRADENGKPMDSGASFSVFKTVVGGDAIPADFKYNLILTGPSGTAQYSIGPAQGQGNPSETLPFNLDLPKGNTLSEGSFQIVETNPGDYIPTYSKGCSGSYDNDGYFYTCSITNTKKVVPNTVSSVANGPKPPLPDQPTITPPVSSKTIGKTTLPTVSNTGKLTLPTTPSNTIGKSTSSSSSGSIIGKTTTSTPSSKTLQSCPKGAVAVNGYCVSKGKIVGTLG